MSSINSPRALASVTGVGALDRRPAGRARTGARPRAAQSGGSVRQRLRQHLIKDRAPWLPPTTSSAALRGVPPALASGRDPRDLRAHRVADVPRRHAPKAPGKSAQHHVGNQRQPAIGQTGHGVLFVDAPTARSYPCHQAARPGHETAHRRAPRPDGAGAAHANACHMARSRRIGSSNHASPAPRSPRISISPAGYRYRPPAPRAPPDPARCSEPAHCARPASRNTRATASAREHMPAGAAGHDEQCDSLVHPPAARMRPRDRSCSNRPSATQHTIMLDPP